MFPDFRSSSSEPRNDNSSSSVRLRVGDSSGRSSHKSMTSELLFLGPSAARPFLGMRVSMDDMELGEDSGCEGPGFDSVSSTCCCEAIVLLSFGASIFATLSLRVDCLALVFRVDLEDNLEIPKEVLLDDFSGCPVCELSPNPPRGPPIGHENFEVGPLVLAKVLFLVLPFCL